MRNSLHRAVLRRVLLRSSVYLAFATAFLAVSAPAAWLGAEAVLARGAALLLAATLLAVPAAVVFAASRRPRARVTAPRAAASGL